MRRICVRFVFLLMVFIAGEARAQIRGNDIQWSKDGSRFIKVEQGNISSFDPLTGDAKILVRWQQLQPEGASKGLEISDYDFSADDSKVLIFTHTARVWRYNTRGDYWLLDLTTNKLRQIGKDRPSQTLMFAKISPDGKKVAYVSDRNIYVEDAASGSTTQLTSDGTRKLINGTFDWVYEEEFGCRDGFRWSPDSKNIAYWQVDATKVRDYLMLNTTDSNYSFVVPVEYPKVGEPPSPVKIGVVAATGGATTWMKIPGDPSNNYLPIMEWAANSNELVVQQLNRKQNETTLYYCNTTNGSAQSFYGEKDKAWIDIKSRWNDGDPAGWTWLSAGKDFLWVTEKDGWRHIYRVSRDGKKESLVTKGNFDIENIECIDEGGNTVYFTASPDNATQLYLYKTSLDGKGKAELVSPAALKGMHSYKISPSGKYAFHRFSSHTVMPIGEWITLPNHKPIKAAESIETNMKTVKSNVEFFQLTTEDGVTVDAWLAKPDNFDSTKKWPLVYTVYGEPAGSTVNDHWGVGRNGLFDGDMAKAGYVYCSVDNRGSPSLKGSEWRKSIYRKIGTLNIRDQAMAIKKLLQTRTWLDTSRVAVHGWSGGGSSTLNLMFQYPEIFKVGIAVAAVGNQLLYDNIYQERYMGIPQENREDFVKGSPITYAKNLQGKLLYIHGTGDDNVHYANAEQLVNELIKYNKQFQFMAYPNRSHGIFEGQGTRKHLNTLFTQFLLANCPPGPR